MDSSSRNMHGGGSGNDLVEGEAKESRNKDRKKSSGRREEKDYRSKERDRDAREAKIPSKDRRKEDRDDREERYNHRNQILKAKEEMTKKKAEGASEWLDWVSKSRKLEDKKSAEKQKAAQLLRMFEEQENMGQEDSEDEEGAPAKVSLDYYTQEEMAQFKKPKKKSSMRKKEKLNLDALEAEADAVGLGVGDLGSRNDRKRRAIREEEERSEAERKSIAYQSAFAKAEEASKSLRMQLDTVEEEDDNSIVDDDNDLYKSLERARKLALKKQNELQVSGPESVAHLAATVSSSQAADNASQGEQHEDRIVITEMEEFVGGLQLDEEFCKLDKEDVFMDEDEAAVSDHEQKAEDGVFAEDKENMNDEAPADDDNENVAPDKTIHEAAVGKGLSGALKLLQDRGDLKEAVEWGGRNMDKKKSKLVGLTDSQGGREVRIERTDEFGRIMTPKESFRDLSHKFHGKGPGKKKQEKRMKQYYEDLKMKQMNNADTPSLSAERMREAQALLKRPYLVISGNVKPSQNSGSATVQKDTGSLMLGDRKVEHFLGIKRKTESLHFGISKEGKKRSVIKPKTT